MTVKTTPINVPHINEAIADKEGYVTKAFFDFFVFLRKNAQNVEEAINEGIEPEAFSSDQFSALLGSLVQEVNSLTLNQQNIKIDQLQDEVNALKSQLQTFQNTINCINELFLNNQNIQISRDLSSQIILHNNNLNIDFNNKIDELTKKVNSLELGY